MVVKKKKNHQNLRSLVQQMSQGKAITSQVMTTIMKTYDRQIIDGQIDGRWMDGWMNRQAIDSLGNVYVLEAGLPQGPHTTISLQEQKLCNYTTAQISPATMSLSLGRNIMKHLVQPFYTGEMKTKKF